MTTGLYQKYRDMLLNPGTLGTTSGTAVDWADDNIKVVLVDAGAYTVNLNTDGFLSDIAGGARIATSANLASKTTSTGAAGSFIGGIADAADFTFTAVSGVPCEALVIYKDTGTASTSVLIAYIEAATGLPVTPNGGDITVSWDNTGNRIFNL